MISIIMSELDNDIDLYVKGDTKPTTENFDCRPYLLGTNSEVCSVEALRDLEIYIGIHGYNMGSFKLEAILDKDTDNDGIFNSQDEDNDNDGHNDGVDDFPLNPNEWLDTDRDGTGNNADPDDDNGGISDADERKWGFDPLDASDGGSADADGDGVSNADEIEAGSNPLDASDTKKPKRFVPIISDDMVIMVPLVD